MLARGYGTTRLEHAVRQALDEGNVGHDRIRQLVAGRSPTDGVLPSLLAAVRMVLPELSQYDRLCQVDGAAGRP